MSVNQKVDLNYDVLQKFVMINTYEKVLSNRKLCSVNKSEY